MPSEEMADLDLEASSPLQAMVAPALMAWAELFGPRER